MRMQRQIERCGWLLLIPLGVIALAFMGLSLAITGTGTARFAVAMGYSAQVGYAVGAIFDFAKALLPVALLVLFARRAFLSFVIIGFAWLGLVTYSALATHATVSTAIAAIERSGSWKMEVRSGTRAELDAVEKRLGVLSQPIPPRPSKTLAEALAVEKVPPGVWRDSRECQSIRDSKYFQLACAKVLDLHRELAAAKDYEQLDVRARELRQVLAGDTSRRDIRSATRSLRRHARPSTAARRSRRRGDASDGRHRDYELFRARGAAGSREESGSLATVGFFTPCGMTSDDGEVSPITANSSLREQITFPPTPP